MAKMERNTRLTIYFTVIILGQLVSWSYSSQKLARVFGYGKALFGRMEFLDERLYWPWAWIGWQIKYGNAGNSWVFDRYGWNISLLVLMASVLIVVAHIIRSLKEKSTTHGTAHFATRAEIEAFGRDKVNGTLSGKGSKFWEIFKSRYKENENCLLSGEGVFLGYLDDGTYLRDRAKTHVLCCAPTRSGKGVGHIIPTLLTWGGSVVVTDIKGENWELTSGYRKSQLGNKVFMFKPTAVGSCKYNPLDEIRICTTNEMGDLQNITKILVDPTGQGSEGANSHWVNNAWDLLQGVALHLLYEKRFHNPKGKKPRSANLSDVLDFLYDGQEGEPVDYEALQKKRREEISKIVESVVPAGNGSEEIRIKVYSEAAEIANNTIIGFNDVMNGYDDSVDMEDGEDVYDGEPVDISNTEAFAKVSKEFDEQVEAKKEETKVLHITGKMGNTREVDLANSKESDTLSGLQKKLKRYITNYDNTGKGFCHAPDDDKELFSRLYPLKMNRDGLHPHVRQIFQSMVDKPDKEFGSILSTLNTALIIYRNPVIVDNIRESDFVMKDLMDCNQPISLYLVFGPGEMDVVRPLLRVVCDMLWRMNTEEMKFEGGKTLEHKHRLLMLLDEFPALGKMEALAVAEGFIAGYGMKAMIITQDLNQINKIYGKDNYVVSNCQVQIYHTPSDNNSSKYLSDKLGNATVQSTSSSRKSVLLPVATGFNDSFTGRPLMYPNEVSTMDASKLLVFCKGLAPIYCNKIRYYEDPIFAERTKIKSPPTSDTIEMADRLWDFRSYMSLLKKEDEADGKDTTKPR